MTRLGDRDPIIIQETPGFRLHACKALVLLGQHDIVVGTQVLRLRGVFVYSFLFFQHVIFVLRRLGFACRSAARVWRSARDEAIS